MAENFDQLPVLPEIDATVKKAYKKDETKPTVEVKDREKIVMTGEMGLEIGKDRLLRRYEHKKFTDQAPIVIEKRGKDSVYSLWIEVDDNLQNSAKQLGAGDALMDDEPQAIGNEGLSLIPGQRLIINDDEFYLLKLDGDELFLEREMIRPRTELSSSSQEDFAVLINDKGELLDVCSGVFINTPPKLEENQGKVIVKSKPGEEVETVAIRKKGKKVFVNDERIKGKYHQIQWGEELAYLVNTGNGWEIVNQDIYERVWKEKLETWDRPAEKIAKGLFRELKELGNVYKPRDFRDVVALAARAVTDIGGPIGAVARGALVAGNFISIGIKESLTRNRLKKRINQAFKLAGTEDVVADIAGLLNGLGLKEEEIDKVVQGEKKQGYLTNKAYWRQTVIGKLVTSELEGNELYRPEKLAAVLVGGVAGVVGMTFSELATLLPGSPIFRTLLSRGFFGWFFPRLITYGGKRLFDAIPVIAVDRDQMSKEAAAQEFVELTLGAMTATVTTLATAGLVVGAVGAMQAQAAERPAVTETVQPTETSLPTTTATAPIPTVTPTEFPTQPATATVLPPTLTQVEPMPTIPVPPTPEPQPTAFAGWQPGQEINDALLDQAAAAGHQIDTTPIQVNIGGMELELFRFDLDQEAGDKIPEVWAIQNEAGDWQPVIWQDTNDQFAVDLNNDGMADGWISEADIPNELIPGNRGGGGEAPRLDFGIRDLDLNDDGNKDLLIQIDDKGKEQFFIDRDQNGVIDPKVDERVEVHFTTIEGHPVDQIERIVFEDGSWWELDRGNLEYTGYLKNGQRIDLDPSHNTTAGKQLTLVNQFKQWHSPFQIGRMAVTEEVMPVPPPAPVLEPAPAPEPEVTVKQDHGQWQTDREGKPVAVQSDGTRLITDVRGGVHGVVQAELHIQNPDLDPDDVGIIVHRMIVEGKEAGVTAFSQPVGDGSQAASAVRANVNLLNLQTAILSVERFLESNEAWMRNNGVDPTTLSDKERFEIGKLFVSQNTIAQPGVLQTGNPGGNFLRNLFINLSEDDIKKQLLNCIKQVEASHD